MRRDLAVLEHDVFDLVVVGGGIYGACVAWDASLRGLSVALVEKGDFGQATSANSLKILHGGLRYVKDGNLTLMRTMIRERGMWLRAAPHLVQPLPFVIPTGRRLDRHKVMLFFALMLNDMLTVGVNRAEDRQKRLPRGRVISRKAYQRLLPGMGASDVTGGAIWHDAVIRDTERLLLSVIMAAVTHGAVAANYVEVTGFDRDEGVQGVSARDVLNGHMLRIRGRVIINCTGPWTDKLLGLVKEPINRSLFQASIALNLVTRRLISGHAVGLPLRGPARMAFGAADRSRMLFIVPWRRYSLIGTWHAVSTSSSPEEKLSSQLVQEFISAVNASLQTTVLRPEDVLDVHWGFLPMVRPADSRTNVKLVRDSLVYDHQTWDGIAGLITVVGVKYTSARATAEKVVDLALQKLGRQKIASRTATERVHGGAIEKVDEFVASARSENSEGVPPDVVAHLVSTYGSEYRQILVLLREDARLCQRITPAAPVIAAEVVHAVREEMAQKLGDVTRRRTSLELAGLPDERSLRCCAQLMAQEMGWGEARRKEEIAAVRAAFRYRRSWQANTTRT